VTREVNGGDRLAELTRLGRVEVRTAAVVPVCYSWPTCCACGCTTPKADAVNGLAPGEVLCSECAQQLKAWAARRIGREVARREAERMRVAGARMEAANSCTCGEDDGLRIAGVPLCDVCKGWAEQVEAQRRAYRRRA
jgi:hypothetical protein